MFLADLVRVLDLPVEIAFVRLSSYGSGTVSSGQIEVVQALREDISGREVLVIEDIIDSGRTAGFLLPYLVARAPVSVRVCTLLDKPQRRQVHSRLTTVVSRFRMCRGIWLRLERAISPSPGYMRAGAVNNEAL